MTDSPMSLDDRRAALVDAALPHVPFDGWSQATWTAAVQDAGIDPELAKLACPRGGIDLALAYHQMGDEMMITALRTADFANLRFRDKVIYAVRARIDAISDKEAVRRGTTLFALPQHAFDGTRAIWGTSDAIWTALGDASQDINWYTKRATLAGVYSATVLYWLGDTSPDHQSTWAFLDRRIEDVMRIEKVKSQIRESPTLSRLLSGPNWLASRVKAPNRVVRTDLPGRWRGGSTNV
jgi:ubiquinone biosynthesis protein COQ9